MSHEAIYDTTRALKDLLERAVASLTDLADQQGNMIHVGPPTRDDTEGKFASLFLFHLQPNAELRNEERFLSPPPTTAATKPADRCDALPLDLRYLITVFRVPNSRASETNELYAMGRIVQAIHAQPTLSGAALKGQTVRLSPEPYPMEEMSRIWSLIPENVYQTSVVYLASPVFVEMDTTVQGPPVRERVQRTGVNRGLRNVLGTEKTGASDGMA